MASRQILSFGDFYTIVWSLVPSVWKSVDDDYGKSLQLVLYTMAQHMYYYFYNKIVYMDELFDPDLCPEKYLKFLAGMVGWTLEGTDPVSWREQIKAAPLLYKIRGTKRGLLLAEKLVGYSVFMSELYRDHIGDIVSKEKIFNNTPDSIKIKPWFRQALTNLEGELLPGRAESDQFDSFNQTNFVKLDSFGNVLRPRVVSNKRAMVFTPSSTTNVYNNITGKYSLARYAKLPRINVVLKYDYDLDTPNLDGSTKENNFSSALDLLLQFKPFHVCIQNLEVRYDLSEFIFDQTAINSDFFNVQEELDASIAMTLDRAENTISYSSNTITDVVLPQYETPTSSLDNRGLISSVYQIINLSEIPVSKETSLKTVFEQTLPVKSFSLLVPKTVPLQFSNVVSSQLITSNRDSTFITKNNNWNYEIGWKHVFVDHNISHIAGNATSVTLFNDYLQTIPVSGQTYQITFDITTTAQGSLTVSYGKTVINTSIYQVGTLIGQTVTNQVTSSGYGLIFTSDFSWAGTIDNISVKNIFGEITRSDLGGSFITEDYSSRDIINITNTTYNNTDYLITSLTDTVLTTFTAPIIETSLTSTIYNKTVATTKDSFLAATDNKIFTLDDFIFSYTTPLTFNSFTTVDPITLISTITLTISRNLGYNSFIQDGFRSGYAITVTNTINNNGSYTINGLDSTGYILYITVPIIPTNEIALSGKIAYTIPPYNIDTNEYIIPVTNALGLPEQSKVVYNPGHAVLQYDLFNVLPDPILDFKAMLSSQHNTTEFIEQTTTPDINGYNKILVNNYIPGLDETSITGISISNEPYRSSVTTIYDTQELVPQTIANPNPLSRPWDLQEVKTFFEGPLGNGAITELPDILTTFKQLYKDTTLVVLELNIEDLIYIFPDGYIIPDGYIASGIAFVLLVKNIDYYFDNTKNIVLNSSSIATHLTPIPTTYDFLVGCKLHILYLSRITYKDETYSGVLSRGFRYVSRINNKFTRQFLIDTLPQQTLSNLMSTDIVSINMLNGGTQQKTVLGTKRFKTSIDIYNRSSLKNEVIDNYNVVSRNPLNRIDKSSWEVYSPEYSTYYSGDQTVTNNWWGNYYEVGSAQNTGGTASFLDLEMTLLTIPTKGSIAVGQAISINGSASGIYITGLISGIVNVIGSVYSISKSAGTTVSADISTSAFIPYAEIDTSKAGQLEHVASNQWLTALQAYNPSDPSEFLVTRVSDANRAVVWNRSSCKFASVPYIRSRRDNLQVFRRDIPTFTRTEESTDYLVDIAVPPRLDNYKYILHDGTDVSLSYFSPGFSIPEQVLVTTDSCIGSKATLTSSGYGLTLPADDTYYSSYSFGTRPETYFTEAGIAEYNAKSSIYAGNIPVNLDPSTNPGITEGLDTLNIIVTGLSIITDDFVASGSDKFTLSKTNLFVNWTDVNTGNIVTFGYYPPNSTTIPNIKVFLNGILIDYKTPIQVTSGYWTGVFDTVKSIIIPSAEINDTVKVIYQVMPETDVNNTFPPLPQIPYTINRTILVGDITTIKQGNRFIYDLPVAPTVNGIPCISWYSSKTAEYISSGSIPIDYQPYALYEEASPNLSIFLNGIYLKYKQDWSFLLKQEGVTTVAAIVLSPVLSMTLSAEDVITINYFSTL